MLMTEDQYCELKTQVKVLEERINTKQAEYKTDIAILAKQNAQRDTRLLIAVVAAIGLGLTILGFIIKA